MYLLLIINAFFSRRVFFALKVRIFWMKLATFKYNTYVVRINKINWYLSYCSKNWVCRFTCTSGFFLHFIDLYFGFNFRNIQNVIIVHVFNYFIIRYMNSSSKFWLILYTSPNAFFWLIAFTLVHVSTINQNVGASFTFNIF